MERFGMEMRGNRPQKPKDSKHINKLLPRYEDYRRGYIDGPFSLPWPSENSPFANWDISDRYANRDHFTQDRLEKHRSRAQDVKELVAKLEKQGLFP